MVLIVVKMLLQIVATGSNFQSPLLCVLPGYFSIYTADSHAIYLALKHIGQSKKESFLVLSGSLSGLKSVGNLKCDHPLLVDLLNLCSTLICDRKDIVLAWIPGQGNTVVDLAAKHALEKPVNKRLAVPYYVFKLLSNYYTKKLWQTEWEGYSENMYTI